MKNAAAVKPKRDNVCLRTLRSINDNYNILYVLIGLFVILSFAATDVFLTPTNLFNVLRQVSMVSIVAPVRTGWCRRRRPETTRAPR